MVARRCARGALLLLWCVVASWGFGGCAAPVEFRVAVSALARPEAEAARSYWLVPGEAGVRADDLQFLEFAEYVHRAMALEGYRRAAGEDDAEIVVRLRYDIGPPRRERYTYSIPHYGETGIAYSTTSGDRTTYYPRYGVIGYSTGVGHRVTYRRTLRVTALDARGEGERGRGELWRASAVSSGSVGNLRRVFPIMLAAARPYLGRATEGGAVEVTLREGDSEVVAIRGGVGGE